MDDLLNEIDARNEKIRAGDPRDWNKPSLAVVARTRHVAMVLWYVGAHVEEQINAIGSYDIEELGFVDEPPEGLSVWSGKAVGGGYCSATGDYNDVDLRGMYRPLTDEEWAAVREARCPWNEYNWLLPHCCALHCEKLRQEPLPFCEEHMKDEALIRAWEEL